MALSTGGRRTRRRTTGQKIALGFGITLLFLVAALGGFAFNVMRHATGSGGGLSGWWATLHRSGQIVSDPLSGFPGQNQLNILCMGIDDNWTTKDMVYTQGSRTDTLFLLSLNLQKKTATMLSIPRDSYVHIAGTNYSDKINSAYSTGGPDRAIQTVAALTGVTCDHYIVLNINATKDMVDALGGVNVDVEHAMRYDDNWGHLHINLQPGYQHLDGQQAVGFARYRHPNPGMPSTPEDGDIRRTYRQHQLLRAMIAKAKSFDNVMQAGHLVDVAMSCVRTNLTRTQLLDLASIYHGLNPDSMVAGTLPGKSFIAPDGQWDYQLDPQAVKAYVAWLVDDNPAPIDHWTTIVVKNAAGVPALAEGAVRRLEAEGYEHVYNGGNASTSPVQLTSSGGSAQSSILDTGVPDPQSAADIAQQLGINPSITRRKLQPNHLGWTPPATLTINLGQDYANEVRDGAAPVGTGGPAAN